jgi:hypothetical protein
MFLIEEKTIECKQISPKKHIITKIRYNIKQPTARAGYRRGQRGEHDKI